MTTITIVGNRRIRLVDTPDGWQVQRRAVKLGNHQAVIEVTEWKDVQGAIYGEPSEALKSIEQFGH